MPGYKQFFLSLGFVLVVFAAAFLQEGFNGGRLFLLAFGIVCVLLALLVTEGNLKKYLRWIIGL